MIDFHTHLLPALDDGSKSCEMSVSMLNMLWEQGIDTVCATPHFDADRTSVDRFLEKRNRSYKDLVSFSKDTKQQILLGAEVAYYDGISHIDNFTALCLEGTDFLLLEMPMEKWSETTVRSVAHMAAAGDVTVVLAHIERYMSLQKDDVWERLADAGALMQVNASFFNNSFTKRKALGYVRDGLISFVGSDCHNISSRKPEIGKAYEIITKKLGEDICLGFRAYQRNIFNSHKNNITYSERN